MKDVVGFEGLYAVGTDGRIWSHKHGYYLRTGGKTKYATVKLQGSKGKPKCMYVHRIVASAFIPNPEGKRTVNHKNGIKRDNVASNLEWATDSEQQLHAISTGLSPNSGETHGRAKLTDSQIAEIINLKGSVTQSTLAERYGVTQGYISLLFNNKLRSKP